MSGFQLATDSKDCPNVSSPTLVSQSIFVSAALRTNDVKCEPIVHGRHVDTPSLWATMLANLMSEESHMTLNNVLSPP